MPGQRPLIDDYINVVFLLQAGLRFGQMIGRHAGPQMVGAVLLNEMKKALHQGVEDRMHGSVRLGDAPPLFFILVPNDLGMRMVQVDRSAGIEIPNEERNSDSTTDRI